MKLSAAVLLALVTSSSAFAYSSRGGDSSEHSTWTSFAYHKEEMVVVAADAAAFLQRSGSMTAILAEAIAAKRAELAARAEKVSDETVKRTLVSLTDRQVAALLLTAAN